LLILSVLPASTVLISFERALVVARKQTRSLTVAMLLELGAAIAVLVLGIFVLDLVGATAASWALLAGRVASTVYLLKPARVALQQLARA
jgi:ABC-type thiamin/hydroxymethylpyrimidine transport system permease subunit